MAAVRSAMLISGAALAGMACVAGLFRAVGLMNEEKVAPEVFWAVLFGMLVVGVMLLVFAPPSRQMERRVELGPPQSVGYATRPKASGSNGTRPATQSSGAHSSSASTGRKDVSRTSSSSDNRPSPTPTTTGPTASPGGEDRNRSPAVGAATTPPAATKPPAAPSAPAGSPRPAQNDPPSTRAAAPPSIASRHHPNDPAKPEPRSKEPGAQPAVADQQAAPPSLRGKRAQEPDRGRTQRQQYAAESEGDARPGGPARQQLKHTGSASPPSMSQPPSAHDGPSQSGTSVPDVDHRVRFQRRRDELETRLESLDQRLNQAKVSMGLGRISHAGYRQYVKEVERERTLIESELMTLRETV